MNLSLALKRRVMHQIAEIPTSINMILVIIWLEPPKMNETRSKLKSPTDPQFKPPMINIMSANLSNIFLESFFGNIAVVHCNNYYNRQRNIYSLILETVVSEHIYPHRISELIDVDSIVR